MIARILSTLLALAFVTLTWRGSLKVEVRRGRGRGTVIEGEHRVIDQK
jgi:hypothetical protein